MWLEQACFGLFKIDQEEVTTLTEQFKEDAQNARLGKMSLTRRDSFIITKDSFEASYKNGQLPAYSKWKSGHGGIP